MSDPISRIKSNSGTVDSDFVDDANLKRLKKAGAALFANGRKYTVNNFDNSEILFKLGGVNQINGINLDMKNRIRTNYLGGVASTYLHIPDGWDYTVLKLSKAANDGSATVEQEDWVSSTDDYLVLPAGTVYRIVFRLTSNPNQDLTEYADSFDEIVEVRTDPNYPGSVNGRFVTVADFTVNLKIEPIENGAKVTVTDTDAYVFTSTGMYRIRPSNGESLEGHSVEVVNTLTAKYQLLMLDVDRLFVNATESNFQTCAASAADFDSALFCIHTGQKYPEGIGERVVCLGALSTEYIGFIPEDASVDVGSLGSHKVMEGKAVAIIGDSISTHGDWGSGDYCNVPEIVVGSEDVGKQLSAYATHYDVGTTVGGRTISKSDVGTEIEFTPNSGDVGKIIGKPRNYNPNSLDVWWIVAARKLGFTPIPVAWSGSSITSHESDDAEYECSFAWHDSQIRKCGIRVPGSMKRESPDAVIVYRGTNDFSHSPYANLTDGYFDSFDYEYPSTDELPGGFGFLEGIALTIEALRKAYPDSKIFLCTLNVFKRVGYSKFPTNNGMNSLPQYNEAIRKASDFFGCGLIEFDKDGITFENCYSEGYITDSQTEPTHPSAKGHRVMGDKAASDLMAQWTW